MGGFKTTFSFSHDVNVPDLADSDRKSIFVFIYLSSEANFPIKKMTPHVNAIILNVEPLYDGQRTTTKFGILTKTQYLQPRARTKKSNKNTWNLSLKSCSLWRQK